MEKKIKIEKLDHKHIKAYQQAAEYPVATVLQCVAPRPSAGLKALNLIFFITGDEIKDDLDAKQTLVEGILRCNT